MATVPYVRKTDAPDTYLETFKAVKHSSRDGLGSGAITDNDTGKSPISRWLSFAFQYSDFVSNDTGATGHKVKCQIPRGTMALLAVARVDTAFVGTGNNDIDVGDGSTTDGWMNGMDFSSTGLKVDPDGAYQITKSDGTGAFYPDGDTVDVLFKNATAPTAGEAILFLQVISYHEDLSREW
jgi:hypothetical protein